MLGSSYIDAQYSTKSREAFTLVEMLAVMGIVVLLLAATLPALRGLNQSESRRGAVGNMMGVLDRARIMAISDGLCTYVVFASADSRLKQELRGCAYAIYQDRDNVTFKPFQKTPWMFLPKGIAFKVSENPIDGNSAASILTCYTQGAAQPTDPSFDLSASAGTGSLQLPYWKFDTMGNVSVPASVSSSQASNYLRLLLFPGYISASGTEIATQNSGGAGNQQKALLEEIDVNPITGRARYIANPTNNLSTPSPTPP